jgi:hypothetical protein
MAPVPRLDESGRADFRAAAERCLDYLAAAFEERGHHRQEPANPAVHYKLPYVFLYGGRRPLALRVLEHIERDLLAADGSFQDPAANGPASSYLYQSGWLAWGSEALGRFDLARRFARRARLEQDGRWGGFWNENAAGRVQWLLNSSSAGAGCAAAGKIAAAGECARFMRRLLDRQPEPDRGFHLNLDPDGEVITDAAGEPTLSFYDYAGPVRPALFATAIAGLVWLGRQTGDADHFDTARDYATVMLDARQARRSPFASKSGWAALQLHAHRPDEDLLKYAQAVGRTLLDRQLADGSIDLTDWPGLEGGAGAPATESSVCDWTLTAVALANGAA